MMDHDINVDDLFGEPGSLELGLSPTAPKGLAQRLDEMRLLGCCQKISWSRLGCIAYISRDGLAVNVRYLHCQPSDGRWRLSEDTPLFPVTEAHGNHPLVHICWNESGLELAVVDSSGRVSIYSISIALNSIAGQRQAAFDPDDEINQVVGMMWLNTQRSVHAFLQAAKVNGRWAYAPFRRRPIGPFHPANKAALICVTRSGLIKLLYQNPDSRWAEISAELKNTSYSDRLLTHASLVATQAGIIVVTHSVCQKICVYRVHVSWNPPQWDPSSPKQSNLFPVPSFRFAHGNVETPSGFWNAYRSTGENEEAPLSTNSIYALTHLEIIPGAADNPTGSTANPWILAVYSNPVPATPDHTEQNGSASIIVRWQLEAASQNLHPKFDEVASKKNHNAQAKPKMELRRLEDIHFDKYVISVDQAEHGTVLAITYDDSSITFYDPKTMAIFNGTDDNSTVTCLTQAGFHSPPEVSGLQISFSPSACGAVMLDSEGQMQLRLMEHSYGAENGLFDESKFSAAIAALTLAFCRGCGSDINTDDILMLVMRQLSSEAQTAFLNEIYRALPINCNFTVDQDKLMNHPYIPRCLSLQAALGFRDRYKPRIFTSAVPWAILHLRHGAVLFAYFFQYIKGTQTDPHDSDVLRMVLGNTRWVLDFSQYILNEVFDLADEFESVLSDQEAFTQKLKTTTSLPLIILLSSMSRTFLRFICRGLRGVHSGYNPSAANLAGDSRIYYSETCHLLDTSPVRIDVYEKFLAGVDSAVRHAYHGAGFGDTERPGPEKELLVNARIPPVLVNAVSAIFRSVVPAVRGEVDRLAVYLGDYTWLGVGDDKRTEVYRRTRDVDILKKIPLRVIVPDAGSRTNTTTPTNDDNKAGAEQRIRRCIRCCEVSSDTHPPRSLPAFQMIARLGLLRSCICGGMWALESRLPGGQLDGSMGSSTSPPAPGLQTESRTPGLMQGS
ncbi:mediator of RNA polymerase II transcription subunit 16 [Aspergillus ruber CBS 135680]|uniref:Mediator of RNA polymerase II transcription subunit 16 n=1 Tax=Aspergillus ruber (strain CBS 135680) TaxID=1388766 RepID=A0A017S2L1_ASPRC|nr:mediator of RNA polymerase II transcription subunit 16 [Aspergillus ruber CBS 135680]EYE91177.1 mediator of RNA polymerase II transcription subunit 16 [Aspergillus ruber CBS 135680]